MPCPVPAWGRPGPWAGTFFKLFFVHYWGCHGSVSGIHSGYQGFSAVRFWPRGSGNTGIHQEAENKKKTGHGNHGPKAEIPEKGGLLTELGIDRLHPEPKNDFLGPGTPKNLQNQQKTKANVKIPDLGGQVGGMGRSLEIRRPSRREVQGVSNISQNPAESWFPELPALPPPTLV